MGSTGKWLTIPHTVAKTPRIQSCTIKVPAMIWKISDTTSNESCEHVRYRFHHTQGLSVKHLGKNINGLWRNFIVWLTPVLKTRQMSSYLHSYGLSGLLPVENAADCKFWLQGVGLNGGPDWIALTGYNHIGVCTCMKMHEHLFQGTTHSWNEEVSRL